MVHPLRWAGLSSIGDVSRSARMLGVSRRSVRERLGEVARKRAHADWEVVLGGT